MKTCETNSDNGRFSQHIAEGLNVFKDRTAEAEAWRSLVSAAHHWASVHMDQWEQVKFETPYGPVYLTLSHKSEHPDSFEAVDAEGNAAPRDATPQG